MLKQVIWELWKKTGTQFLTVFSLFSYLLDGFTKLEKFFFTLIVMLLAVINYLIIKLVESNNYRLLKVSGLYVGSGVFEGKDIIKIEYNRHISSNTILRLHTKGKGVLNPICLLVIIDIVQDEYLQAIVLENDENNIDIKEICSDNNKIDNLYASVIIKY